MTLRILHVTLSATQGGGPEHIYQLLSHLPADATLPLVAAPRQYPYWDCYEKLVGRSSMQEVPYRRFSLLALIKLLYFCNKQQVQILHSHGKGAGVYVRIVSLLTGIPCVHTFHGIHLDYATYARRAYILLEWGLGKISMACIAVSKGEAAKVLALKLCPPERLHVVQNGVVIPGSIPEYRSKNPFTIMHMSRFEKVKNSLILLDIAQILKTRGLLDGIKFIILGNGDGRYVMEKAVIEAGLTDYFSFEGFKSNPRAYLRGAGCYISTSLWEGMPLAVMEAMAEGVPVVASDVIGNRDAVRHGETGFLFSLEDLNAAVSHIHALRIDPDLRERIGHEAHRTASKHYSARSMALQTLKVYQRVAGSKCKKPLCPERRTKSNPTEPLRVSLITPSLNAAACIRRTMDSVAAQTYSHIEYIVMDGGSNDGTVDIIRQHPRVNYWSSSPDAGIASAFNKGLAQATGDVVGIINADDWYEANAVEQAVNAIRQGADVVHGAIRFWDGQIPYEIFRPNQARLTREMSIFHPSVFVRRELYERLGLFDESYRYAMDYELLLRFMVYGAHFAQLDTVIANVSFDGISDKYWKQAYREADRARRTYLGRPLRSRLYLLWQLGRTGIRRNMQKKGLESVIRAYRRHFLKKIV